MNNDTRNILIQLRILEKLIDLKDNDIRFYYDYILETIKTSLEEKKENLTYELYKINENLELLKEIEEEKKN